MTITTPRPTRIDPLPATNASDGTKLRQAQHAPTPNQAAPAGSTSRPTEDFSMPVPAASDGTKLADRRLTTDAHARGAVGDQLPDSPADHRPMSVHGSLESPELTLAAAILDDLEATRKAQINRLSALTRDEPDKDGVVRGAGLAGHPDVVVLEGLIDGLKALEHKAELHLGRVMRKHPLHGWVKSMRGVGLKQSARLLAAIGDPYIRPELTRADGTVIPEGPRTVSALWAYCGLHVLPAADQCTAQTQDTRVGGGDSAGGDSGHTARDSRTTFAGVAARRQRGVRCNWSTEAKTRAYLIATSCLKQIDKTCRAGQKEDDAQPMFAGPASDSHRSPGQVMADTQHWRVGAAARHLDGCRCSPYRIAYDGRRARTAITRPDWTPGHSHADGLRVASKEILKDLWRAARDVHHGGAA